MFHHCYFLYFIFGYGITEKLAFEFEAAVITAKQYKSKDDPSNMPDKFEESGLGVTPKATDYAPEFGVLFHF